MSRHMFSYVGTHSISMVWRVHLKADVKKRLSDKIFNWFIEGYSPAFDAPSLADTAFVDKQYRYFNKPSTARLAFIYVYFKPYVI